MESYRRQVCEAADYVRKSVRVQARIGIILGTGLGQLAEEIEVSKSIGYEELPYFPTSTVESHSGRLIAGSLAGAPVLAMQGRFHLYEGYSPRQVTLPVRIMGELGIDRLLISNAAGGMNPYFRCSDLMLITDHINLQGSNPLAGPNVDEWGPRFPDMSAPYDRQMQQVAREKALEAGIRLQEGVYVAVEGPSLETRAEYRFLRQIGGDAVGMSTVPEVIVARHMGMRVLAASVITDECLPDALEEVVVEDILAAAAAAQPQLTALFRDVVRNIYRLYKAAA